MAIRIPDSASTRRKRWPWLAGAGLVAGLGLFFMIGSLAKLNSIDDLIVVGPIVGLGALYIFAGIKTVVRVSGVEPELRIRPVILASLTATSAVAALGILGSLFIWALSQSVWANEGGDPSTAPDGGLIAAGIFLGITIASALLTIVANRLDDPPPNQRRESPSQEDQTEIRPAAVRMRTPDPTIRR